jgi:hypothetical protein
VDPDARFDHCLQGDRALKISVTMRCGILGSKILPLYRYISKIFRIYFFEKDVPNQTVNNKMVIAQVNHCSRSRGRK